MTLTEIRNYPKKRLFELYNIRVEEQKAQEEEMKKMEEESKRQAIHDKILS